MKSPRLKNPSKRDLLTSADCINQHFNCVNTFVITTMIVSSSHVRTTFGLLKKSRACARIVISSKGLIFRRSDRDESNVGRELGAIRHDLNVVWRHIILKDRRRQRLSYMVIMRIMYGNLLQQQIFPQIPAINALLLRRWFREGSWIRRLGRESGMGGEA